MQDLYQGQINSNCELPGASFKLSTTYRVHYVVFKINHLSFDNLFPLAILIAVGACMEQGELLQLADAQLDEEIVHIVYSMMHTAQSSNTKQSLLHSQGF